MISVVLVASIALAVVLGYKTKINTGFSASHSHTSSDALHWA